MLTSFLKKSQPGTIVFLMIYLSFAYGIYLISTLSEFNLSQISVIVIKLIAFLFMIQLFNFIIHNNKITDTTDYAIFLFTFFTLFFPEIFENHSVFFASVFLLLAMRRLFSLEKDTNTVRKIVDASLWITIASMFYFWSIIYLLPLWLSILQKPNRTYKHFLMPLAGVFLIMIIAISVILLSEGSLQWFQTWIKPTSLDFTAYNEISLLIPTTTFISFGIWIGFYKIFKFSSYSLKEKSRQFLQFYIFMFSLLLALLTPEKTGAEMFFLIPPAAIIAAPFFEEEKSQIYRKERKIEIWFKEFLLWIIVIIGLIFMF